MKVADLKQQFGTRKDCNAKCTVGCVRTTSHPDRLRGQRRPDPGPPAHQLVQLGKKQLSTPAEPTAAPPPA